MIKVNPVEVSTYDSSGMSTPFHSSMPVPFHKDNAIRRTEYDSRGRRVSESEFDKQNTLRETRRYKYDPRGNLIELETYGPDGVLVASSDFGSIQRRSYDKNDNHTKVEYFGRDEQSTISRFMGYASKVMSYDENGLLTEERFYGTDGQLMCNPPPARERAAIVKYQYDTMGNVVEMACFGIDSALVEGSPGIAITRTEFDSSGNKTSQSYFDTNEDAAANYYGVAAYQWKHDSLGNETEEKCFGIDGALVEALDGYAIIRTIYDDNGYVSEYSHYGLDEMLEGDSLGFATIRTIRNDFGDMLEASYLDDYGLPTTFKGTFVHRFRYDNRGNSVEEAYFDADGQPMAEPDGVAKRQWDYNADNQQVEVRRYARDGLPISATVGIPVVRWKYDNSGNCNELSFYDGTTNAWADSSGVSLVRMKFDASSRVIERRTFGKDKTSLIEDAKGYALYRFRYKDSSDVYTEMRVYSDKEILKGTVRRKVDDNGNVLSGEVLDGQGNVFEEF